MDSEALHKKSLHIDFSVHPLCSLCLGGVFLLEFINHRDTENTEIAQRNRHFLSRILNRSFAVFACTVG